MHPMYPSTTQVLTAGATSVATTNAVGAHTQVVMISAVNAVYVKFDGTPTATTSDMIVQAGHPQFFAIKPGQKVAVLQVSSGGVVSITEMTQ